MKKRFGRFILVYSSLLSCLFFFDTCAIVAVRTESYKKIAILFQKIFDIFLKKKLCCETFYII